MRMYCKNCGGTNLSAQRECHWNAKTGKWEAVNADRVDGTTEGYCYDCEENREFGVIEAVWGEKWFSQCSVCGGNHIIHNSLYGFFEGKWQAFNHDTETGYCHDCDDYTKAVTVDHDPHNGCVQEAE